MRALVVNNSNYNDQTFYIILFTPSFDHIHNYKTCMPRFITYTNFKQWNSLTKLSNAVRKSSASVQYTSYPWCFINELYLILRSILCSMLLSCKMNYPSAVNTMKCHKLIHYHFRQNVFKISAEIKVSSNVYGKIWCYLWWFCERTRGE